MASKGNKTDLANNKKNEADLILIPKEEFEEINLEADLDEDDCSLEYCDDEDDSLVDEIDNDDDYEPLAYEEDDEEFVIAQSTADGLVFKKIAANKDKQDKKPKNDKPKDAPKKPTTPVASTPKPVSTNITYAPKIEPVEGVFELCCIGIKWKDHKAPKGSVTGMGNSVAKTYSRLSGGKLKFKVTGKTVDVGLNFAKKNLNKAEKIAMAVVNKAKKSGKYDLFAIASGMGGSHAGRNIAHLQGTLLRTALHELGHILPNSNKARKLPSKLGHSGVMEWKNGKYTADNTGDPGSFMGRYASTTIAGPQFYYEGWLDVMQVASHDPSKTMVYKLQPVSSEQDQPDCLKGVLIPRTAGRDQFLSVAPFHGKQILNLYYTTGGGSQKIAGFGQKPFTFQDIIIQEVAREDNILTVEIKPNPEFNGNYDDQEIVADEDYESEEYEGEDYEDSADLDEVDDGDVVVKNKPKNRHKPKNK